jgi:hypothetical protein
MQVRGSNISGRDSGLGAFSHKLSDGSLGPNIRFLIDELVCRFAFNNVIKHADPSHISHF